jgi:hypothetical protein
MDLTVKAKAGGRGCSRNFGDLPPSFSKTQPLLIQVSVSISTHASPSVWIISVSQDKRDNLSHRALSASSDPRGVQLEACALEYKRAEGSSKHKCPGYAP